MSETVDPTSEKVKLEVSVESANERKQEGNDYFRAGSWDDALATYKSALGYLPNRDTPKETEDRPKDPREATTSTEPDKPIDVEEDAPIEVSTPAVEKDTVEKEDEETPKLRAVLNANIAACLLKLGQHKEAVEACSAALLDDPTYVKALERRANCNDTLGTWSSLTSAQEDYNKLLTLVPPGPQQADIRRKLNLLKPRLEAAQKGETDEMLGKLKGLGNSLLGNFGLSTDNFQFVPNGQGGYSVNFTR